MSNKIKKSQRKIKKTPSTQTNNKKPIVDKKTIAVHAPTLTADLISVNEAKHANPFSVLGRHTHNDITTITVYAPYSEKVYLDNDDSELTRIPDSDFFQCELEDIDLDPHYRLKWVDKDTHEESIGHDAYSFGAILPEFDQQLFSSGNHWHIYKKLGAHIHVVDSIEGVYFAVWAPNASRVSVIGDFNRWDGRCNPMRCLSDSGIWEIFLPALEIGCTYKFEIFNSQTQSIAVKTDPYGQQFELRPQTASIVADETGYLWADDNWMEQRKEHDWIHEAMSIYEIHLGSWKRDAQGNFLNYRDLAKELVEYVNYMGFTHIELLPITEHPLDDSWGYQATGYFAPTSRHGTPDDFRYFVDVCHQNNIGIILDWVPAHFPKDSFALAQFDGTALYEHEDPRRGEHRDWGTLIYNYSRSEVKNFLLASANFWLEEYHLDGLRVDAVASMLYLDYSREEGDWVANMYGGNENLEAIDFMRHMNTITHEQHPGTVVIAEESTSWPQVTRPTWTGGLGFSMKWNMGWMHDMLSYMQQDPVHRMHHHDNLTFGMLYAFSENFVLPFSHDEVVHGKGSMLNKMPGDDWQKFANLRLLYTFMFTYPGKKLLFMGCEFGQGGEWNFSQSLDWYVNDYANHKGIMTLVKDLNHMYTGHPALFQHDFDDKGFEWIDCHDLNHSIISYRRKTDNEELIVILNFTPVVRSNYRIGVPSEGFYTEIFNSDSSFYDGSNRGNASVHSEPTAWMNLPHSINLTLPPLAGIVLKL